MKTIYSVMIWDETCNTNHAQGWVNNSNLRWDDSVSYDGCDKWFDTKEEAEALMAECEEYKTAHNLDWASFSIDELDIEDED